MSECAENKYCWKAVEYWLYAIAFLIIMMVVVGGLTRLTGSGLSITEWKPIHGAIPPLNYQEWLEEFNAYKLIPQFKLVNPTMTLDEFKTIFWWEWGHRQLGRFVGLVFFIPLVIFWLKGAIPRTYKSIIIALFLGGGLQGLIGWLMVKSGLVDRVTVSQYRLALHLTMALVLYYFVLHTAFKLNQRQFFNFPKWSPSVVLTLFVFVQIISGAFTAGTHAGYIYNTWPLMDGSIIPNDLLPNGFISLFEDRLTVQFTHRILAYSIIVIALWVVIKKIQSKEYLHATLCSVAVLGQVKLGVITLVTVAPVAHIELAALHQFGAVILLSVCCYMNAYDKELLPS